MAEKRHRAHRLACLGLAAAGALLTLHGLWIPAKAVLAQQLLERAWQRTLSGRPRAVPWPWADTFPVARLSLPGRNLLVLAESGGQGLAFGPTHVAGSAAPGATGITVISAHRDTHFRGLDRIKPGTEITLQARDGRTRAYRVSGSAVLPGPAITLPRGASRNGLVLITCWPLDGIVPGGRERFALYADEIPGPAGLRTSIRR